MLVLRRFAAILVGMLFAPVLAIAVFLMRVDQTLLSSSFYVEQLRERGVYEFLAVDLLGTVAREALDSPAEAFDSPGPVSFIEESDLTAEQVVAAVHKGFSPQQLQELVEPVVTGVVDYATAERDQVQIPIEIGPSVNGLLSGALDLLHSSGFYEWVIEEEILPAASEFSEDALSADSGFVAGILRRVVTPDWLAATVQEVSRPIVDYVFAESDQFTIRIGLSESQVDVIASEIATGLPGEEVAGLFRTHVLAPAIAAELANRNAPPSAAAPSPESVAAAILAGASPDLVDVQLARLADDLGDYLSGRDESFSTQFDLTELKESARPAVASLVREEILLQLESLPECGDQTDSAVDADISGLPNCLPPGVSAEEFVEVGDAGSESLTVAAMLDTIPDHVAFSESDLRHATNNIAGEEAFANIDDWRSLAGQGFEYSHLDFRNDLAAAGDLEEFDEFRSFFAHGIVLSADETSAAGFNSELSEGLGEIREWVPEFRRIAWTAIALAAVLLLLAGFLAGNNGPSRLRWGSAVLAAASIFWLLIVWPAFEFGSAAGADLARAEFDLTDAGPFSETAVHASNYAIDSVFAVISDFMSGPRLTFSVLAALGIAGVIGAQSWRNPQRKPSI